MKRHPEGTRVKEGRGDTELIIRGPYGAQVRGFTLPSIFDKISQAHEDSKSLMPEMRWMVLARGRSGY